MTVLRQRQPTGHTALMRLCINVNDVDSTSQQHRVPRGKSMPSENVIGLHYVCFGTVHLFPTPHMYSVFPVPVFSYKLR